MRISEHDIDLGLQSAGLALVGHALFFRAIQGQFFPFKRAQFAMATLTGVSMALISGNVHILPPVVPAIQPQPRRDDLPQQLEAQPNNPFIQALGFAVENPRATVWVEDAPVEFYAHSLLQFESTRWLRAASLLSSASPAQRARFRMILSRELLVIWKDENRRAEIGPRIGDAIACFRLPMPLEPFLASVSSIEANLWGMQASIFRKRLLTVRWGLQAADEQGFPVSPDVRLIIWKYAAAADHPALALTCKAFSIDLARLYWGGRRDSKSWIQAIEAAQCERLQPELEQLKASVREMNSNEDK